MGNDRRDKGEGSIYQRKDGRWVAEMFPPGSTKKKYFYGKTEKDVKKKLKDFQIAVIKNGYAEIKKISVSEYMSAWMNEIKIHEVRPKTFDRIEVSLVNHVFPYVGDIQMGSIKASDVQGMVNALVKRGLSYSSIKQAYNAMNNCFKLGLIKNEIIKNPCLGVVLPKNIKKSASDIRFFSDAEVRMIYDECNKLDNNGKPVYRMGSLIVLLLYSGLRIGEALALRWSDIDLERKRMVVGGSVIVIKNRTEQPGAHFVVTRQDSTKTESGNRIVYLNEKALEAIRVLHQINGEFEYVTATASGGLQRHASVDRVFKRKFPK